MNNVLTRISCNKIVLALCYMVLLCFSGCKSKHATSAKKPPNIIFIFADDLGYGDIGAYGSQKIRTPHIDSVAHAGVRFTDAHSATSLCTPSRYAILTGRDAWRTRLKKGVLPSWGKPLVSKDRTTIASLLKKGGYYTAAVGKWHLGFNWPLKKGQKIMPKQLWSEEVVQKINWNGTLSGGPRDHGFDYYYGIPSSINMLPYVIIENNRVTQAPITQKNWYDTDKKDAMRAPNWSTIMMGAKLTEKAVSVINSHFKSDKKQPLFLYYAATSPHRPDVPNFTKGWSDAGLRGDMVAQFDWQVGQVVKALKENGEFKNTLLIITSDNGPRPGDPLPWLKELRNRPNGQNRLPKGYRSGKYHPKYAYHMPNYGAPWITYGHRASGPLLGFKGDPWDGGHRIPFIVSWPNKIKKARVNDDMFCLSDLMATFADLTDQKLSKNEGEDSDDMLPAFLGTNTSPIRKTMVNAAGWDEFTLRKGPWKLINIEKMDRRDTHYPTKVGKGRELYNLKEDIGEKHNVLDQHPKLVKKMRQLLHKYKSQGHSADRLEKTH